MEDVPPGATEIPEEELFSMIIGSSPISGNGLFAYKDFSEGETFFSVERPMVTALDNRRIKDTCANCFEWTADIFFRHVIDEFQPPSLKTCTGCKTLRYCSKRCQSQAWKREHKHVCKLLNKVQTKGTLPNAARAVLDMLGIATRPNGRHLREMKSHLNTITAKGGERAETLLVLSTGIHEYSGTPLGIEHVQNMFALVLTNSLTIYTSTFDPLGICVDPIAAKANHSCDPNCVIVWEGPSLRFRTMRPIKEGEEIFISYIDASQPYSRRQHELKEKFYFTCECAKCQLKWSGSADKFLKDPVPKGNYGGQLAMKETREDIAVPASNEMMLGKAEEDADYLGSKKSYINGLLGLRMAQKIAYQSYKVAGQADELDHMRLLNSGLRCCLDTKIWPESRQPVPMIRHNAFNIYLTLGKRFGLSYVLAFLQGLKLYFDSWPIIHPEPFHPLRVVLKWMLVHLALFLASYSDREEVKPLNEAGMEYGVVIWGLVREVQDNVQKSHGKEHSFAKTVNRKVLELKTDMTRADPNSIRWAESQVPNQWKVLRKLANNLMTNSFTQFHKETEADIKNMVREGLVVDESGT